MHDSHSGYVEIGFGAYGSQPRKLLHALIEERSVTRAGLRLGLSQPAASRALARLRLLMGDRLVVRSSSGLELTPRAEALADPVRRVIAEMEAIVTPTIFDPATVKGPVTIAAIDRLVAMIAPPLVARLAREAPLLDLEFTQPAGDNIALVVNGTADLALGVFADMPAGLFRRALDREDFVCIVRDGHPVLSKDWTPECFAALPHVAVRISGHGGSVVDAALSKSGLQRRVTVRVPNFLAAVVIVAESDLIMSLPRQLAHRMAATFPIVTLEMPLLVPSFTATMIWHERQHDDPVHRWLRERVADAAQSGGRLP